MKNKMIYFVVGIISTMFSFSYAQDVDSFSPRFKAAKMYVNSSFELNKNASNFVSLLRTFSPSISWGREFGNFHEISIQDFGVFLTDISNAVSFNIDYSYNLKLGSKDLEQKVNFFVGIGAKTGWDYLKNKAVISTSFNNSSNRINLDMVFTPRVTIRLSKRTYLDINVPYSLVTTNRVFYKTENPELPVDYRARTDSRLATFPNQFTVRVGVAIKF